MTDLGSPDIQRELLLIASQSIGGVAAFAVAPWLPDVLGRKWAIAIGDVILVAGALGQTFVNTSGGYIGKLAASRISVGAARTEHCLAGTRLIIGFGGEFSPILQGLLQVAD